MYIQGGQSQTVAVLSFWAIDSAGYSYISFMAVDTQARDVLYLHMKSFDIHIASNKALYFFDS